MKSGVSGVWGSLEPGFFWSLDSSGVWSLRSGVWSLESEVRRLGSEVWSLKSGGWGLESGVRKASRPGAGVAPRGRGKTHLVSGPGRVPGLESQGSGVGSRESGVGSRESGVGSREGVKAGRRGCPRGRGKTHLVSRPGRVPGLEPGTRPGARGGNLGPGLASRSRARGGRGRAPGCPRGRGSLVSRPGRVPGLEPGRGQGRAPGLPQGAGARPGKAARGGLLGRGLRRESGVGEAEARRRGCPGGRDKAVRAARVEESGGGSRQGQGRGPGARLECPEAWARHLRRSVVEG